MSNFLGWEKVAKIIKDTLAFNERLNSTQKESVNAILNRIANTGVIIADEVGMGKTRIAVELIHAVKQAGGRTAIIVPTTLGFQWQKELNDREADLAPQHTVNSLWRFMSAWADGDKQEHWDKQSVILLSQNFANWRIGGNSHSSRWALLPEVYAQWRKAKNNRLPNGYNSHEDLKYMDAEYCARRIVEQTYYLSNSDPRKKILYCIIENFEWGVNSFGGDNFSAGSEYRNLLEKTVGLGLGSFDLVVIDEAHKSRGESSSLSRILNEIIIQNDNGRRLAMTATPVELNVEQWQQMLNRIELSESDQQPILKSVDNYAKAVAKLKLYWKVDEQSRLSFQRAARAFENSLKPYLLRRDKRQDPTIQQFHSVSNLPINAYRKHTQVEIKVEELSEQWKQIVCSVEGLSAASIMQDATSKRARLTLANGHGIAAIIDNSAYSSHEDDDDELESDLNNDDSKKLQRAHWWKKQITEVYASGDESLYQHPALLKVISEIENNLMLGQKALVFGKLTKPMRILVNLLNAREMLRRLDKKEFWPQTKVHISDKENDDSEVHAAKFASKQLGLNWSIDEINDRLKRQYEKHANQVDQTKQHLIENIEHSISLLDTRCEQLFKAFKKSVEQACSEEHAVLTFMTRAIYELSDSSDFNLTSEEVAQGFIDLMGAVTAENEGDADGDGQLDEKEASKLWPCIEARVKEEYEHVRGGMARLMYGNTSAASRRMLQLGFNRKNSFPYVLVAQSVVGREGLNLHQACRFVYLLHPEWNPGVVEQQIGRVDRLGSRWEKEFYEQQDQGGELPFIEIKQVIFKGTYDEYNWQVLHARWDQLRSQLHGVVIPISERDDAFSHYYDELCSAAPDFTP
ncbi:DEAD/DEAH box helicase [Pseudoalteromonas prydzensis]|uniref:DEAD/DEAH box helicase family protein n=1 Tax=Pseudoalteromonas prydzensis TaxID=182141 RepID=A0ABR9FN51_9GAMM|nr:SNF2-related protein [Pseudoalteromonas prydzensis]MBE0458239.1 DEAD/DEAH box helicase family protein [Pseudoalteromonas prydzensis]